ncbi:PEP-CTERM sorting domain-containing protein [Sphingomonas sp. JC676]|uniref:FxDxF family PEP-CTERM protein n=1 Tax=Sphingomonas sp. JC676 TaxID=2768065 RepID=UPI0016581742|nr:PEP-CTERM sorting domain-containing protein [Sphingomonas sp. JC676]
MTRKLLALALGAAAILAFTPANAQTYFGPADINTSFGPGGTISASFGQSGIVAGMFQHIYQFTLPVSGSASGSVTTSAVLFHGVGDLDLTSVFLNGVQLTGITGALNEVVFANAVPIVAGVQNELIINGISRGNGSYGGQGVFVSNAVPEPAAWGMLIGGFGLAGMAVRRRTVVLAKA